ncbi:MAG TPA: TonB family protein [Verrucomicrobiae bacterium]
MTRLQKKCLIATAGTHLLAVVLVLCSGFVTSQPKPDDSQVLTVIPEKAIDELFKSGVKAAQPPPPEPVVKPLEQPTPLLPLPKPVVHSVEPPKPVEPVKPPVKPQPEVVRPEPVKPADKPDKPVKPTHEIIPDLKSVVRKAPNVPDTRAADAAREKLAREQHAKELQRIAQNLKNNFKPDMTIAMPGDSSAAYANYSAIVKSKYDTAWTPPDNAANDEANVKVSVTIGNDGRVISAHIIDKSGDASVDDSVQRTLDRVTFIAPFPDGATDKQRTYIINFNLKAKRMLG